MEIILLATVALLLCLVLTALYQVVKQQGRLLLRLDEIENRLQSASHPVAGPTFLGDDDPAEPQELPVGTTFPSFRLPDLKGQSVGLDDFTGRRVLLVNWSPQCGFCDLIAPDLARLQDELKKNNTELVLSSYGDADSNRRLVEEHGLECPVLLQEDNQTLQAFDGMGTPVAYLLDEHRAVAKPLAVGADEVPTLAREASSRRKRLPRERSLKESRLERDGLKAGTPAPKFSLPDIEAKVVSLDDYVGQRVLLVFTDPDCVPCDALLPDLVRLQEEHRGDGLSVIMVGRGDAEENRRKAKLHGVQFPIALQQGWRLSKEYGIFATPVAFLIGPDGVIARDVAEGAEAILALAEEGLTEMRRAG